MTEEGTRQDLEHIIAGVIQSCVPDLHADVCEWTAQQVRARLDIGPETYQKDSAVYRWVSGWHRKNPLRA